MDHETGTEFKVLKIESETVEIVDRLACRRVVNRIILENQITANTVEVRS